MEMSGAAGDGRLRRNRPSCEPVSTKLTLVWAIAGICRKHRGFSVGEEHRGGVSYGIAYVGRHVEDE
jgi:hypothetical protein